MARPRKYIINANILESLYNDLQNWNLVAEKLGCSKSTMYRLLNELGISKSWQINE